MFKTNKIKEIIKEDGLALHGTRQELITKHSRYIDLYNSNQDHSSPKSRKELVREFQAIENNGFGAKRKADVSFKSDIYMKEHKGQFDEMIETMKRSKRLRKEQKELTLKEVEKDIAVGTEEIQIGSKAVEYDLVAENTAVGTEIEIGSRVVECNLVVENTAVGAEIEIGVEYDLIAENMTFKESSQLVGHVNNSIYPVSDILIGDSTTSGLDVNLDDNSDLLCTEDQSIIQVSYKVYDSELSSYIVGKNNCEMTKLLSEEEAQDVEELTRAYANDSDEIF
jgi:hypothetical protein